MFSHGVSVAMAVAAADMIVVVVVVAMTAVATAVVVHVEDMMTGGTSLDVGFGGAVDNNSGLTAYILVRRGYGGGGRGGEAH